MPKALLFIIIANLEPIIATEFRQLSLKMNRRCSWRVFQEILFSLDCRPVSSAQKMLSDRHRIAKGDITHSGDGRSDLNWRT